MKDFEIIQFDFNNEEHLILLDKIIDSPNSKLISSDIRNFVNKNIVMNKEDNITNCFIIKYNNEMIGLSFLNYHPEETIDGELLPEEIEIGLGLLQEYRGKGLGSLFEKEFSEYLLSIYPQFNEVVARVEKENIPSTKSIIKSGFIQIKEEEYHFKR